MDLRQRLLAAAGCLCLALTPLRAGAEGGATATDSGSQQTNTSGGSNGTGQKQNGQTDHMGRKEYTQRLNSMVHSIADVGGGGQDRHAMAGHIAEKLANVPPQNREAVLGALHTLRDAVRSGQVTMEGTHGSANAFMKANADLFDSKISDPERGTLQALVTLQQNNFFTAGSMMDKAGIAAANTLAGHGADPSGGTPASSPGHGPGGSNGSPQGPGHASSQAGSVDGISQSSLRAADALSGGNNPYIKGMLADSLLQTGDRAGAIRAATEAAAMRPDYARPQVVLAQANYQEGDYAAAHAAAEKALQADPSNGAALAVLKMTDGRTVPTDTKPSDDFHAAGPAGDRSRETADLPVVRSLKPASASLEDRTVAVRLASKAERLSRQGDFAGAAEHAAKALARDPGNDAARLAHVHALIRQHRMEEALKSLQEALARSPDNARLLVARSNVFNMLKRHSEALADADAALKANPKSAEALVNRAWALDGLGQRREALESLARAAALNSDYRDLYENARALQDGDLAQLLSGEAVPARATSKPKPGDAGLFGLGRGVGLGLAVLVGVLMVALGSARLAARSWSDGLRRAFGAVARRPATTGSYSAHAAGDGMLGGAYRVVRQLGQGGMGIVYEAMDLNLGRRVAVKRMHPMIRADALERDRFIREARMAASLHHPNIVDIYRVVEDGEDAYLIFEYVDGWTLHDLMQQRGRLSLPVALSVLEGAAAGLDYAHAKGVVHRDLKPSNIMLSKERDVKVVDFGVAMQAKESMARLTVARTVVGTPQYMAPEQEQGLSCTASDVYALGVCLYRMVTGRHPFSGDGGALSLAKVRKAYEPASSLVPGLPAGFDEVLDKALEPEPSRRWQSAGELARSLKALPLP